MENEELILRSDELNSQMSIIVKKVEILQRDKRYVEEENIELKRKLND